MPKPVKTKPVIPEEIKESKVPGYSLPPVALKKGLTSNFDTNLLKQ
jgi:hypothetical protein